MRIAITILTTLISFNFLIGQNIPKDYFYSIFNYDTIFNVKTDTLISGILKHKTKGNIIEFEFKKSKDIDSISKFKYFVYSIPSVQAGDSIYYESDIIFGFDGVFQNGWRKFYYSDTEGNKTSIGLIENFNNGKLNGETTGYYENGTVMFTGKYKDNARIGKWTTYYETGMKMNEAEYFPQFIIAYTQPILDKDTLKIYLNTESTFEIVEDYYDKRLKKYMVNNSTYSFPIIDYCKSGVMKNWDRKGKLINEIEYK